MNFSKQHDINAKVKLETNLKEKLQYFYYNFIA